MGWGHAGKPLWAEAQGLVFQCSGFEQAVRLTESSESSLGGEQEDPHEESYLGAFGTVKPGVLPGNFGFQETWCLQ